MSSSPSSDDTRVGSEKDVLSDGFVELISNTHDISHTSKHIPTLSDFTADLEAATHAVWSRRHESRYSRAYAIFLRWESDDLGVVTDSNDLQHVFQDLYHYQVESYKIPDERPDTSLKRRILQFLENDGKDILLILYYAGHAKKNQSNAAPIWHANRNPRSPSLACGGVQSMLEEAHSDVLLLYDCCHSAATTISPSIGGYKGVTEVISACGYETMAPPVCEHSFSKALTQILASASQGSPFSVGELHMRVLNRLMCWTPCLVQDQDRKFIRDLDGRLAYEQQPRRTPIYTIICETEPRRSIIIAPLKQPTSISECSKTSNEAANSISRMYVKPLDTRRNPVLKRKQPSEGRLKTSCDLKRQRSNEKEIEYPQVLLAIRLESETFDQAVWLEWLRMAPPECRDVKIEGTYDSFSTLLLVRISVATWNLLPENPAYSFVGFVTSENKACKLGHLEVSTTCREINTETPPLYDPQLNSEVKQRGSSSSEAAAQLARSRNDEKGSTTSQCQATAHQSSSEWTPEEANNPHLDDQRATKLDQTPLQTSPVGNQAGVEMASIGADCAICSQPAIARCNCEVKGLDTVVKQAEQRIMANMFNDIDTHSSTLWNDNITLPSQKALLEDWVLPPSRMMTSVVNSPLDYSPSLSPRLEALSPGYSPDFSNLTDLSLYTTGDRVVGKTIRPTHSKAKDLAAATRRPRSLRTPRTSVASDESVRMVGLSSLEIDNTARDHPLYQNVTPKADGLYHCPWEGQDNCQHEPEKLKCNYDKSVDSHLKPYRCRVVACENYRFSSTACLLRHEREAHAMHGHSDKPYLCTYKGCERGVAGNGFPRHWNLRDHLKRVHNDPGPSTKSNSPPSSNPPRSKHRRAEATESPVVENALKRMATPPVVAVKPEQPSLIDRYYQSEQRLLEITKQLNDPLNENSMALLRSASDCIKVMAQTTQRINAPPGMNF